jgi:hypothetical protein
LVFSHAGINLQQKKIQELKQKIYELTGTKMIFKQKNKTAHEFELKKTWLVTLFHTTQGVKKYV